MGAAKRFKARMAEVLVSNATCFQKMAFNFKVDDPDYSRIKRHILTHEYPWEFMLGVAQSNGKEQWFSWETVSASDPCLFHDINKLVEDRFDRLKNSVNHNHYVGLCWAAMPCGMTFSEEHLADYMIKQGIFDART